MTRPSFPRLLASVPPQVRNRRATFGLLALVALTCALLGWLLLGGRGLLVGLVVGGGLAAGLWRSGDLLVERLIGAEPVAAEDEPELQALLDRVAARTGLARPRLLVIAEPAPNACALGWDGRGAAVAVTSGLLDLLDEDEVAAVLSHALALLRDRDAQLGTALAAVVWGLTLPAEGLIRLSHALIEAAHGYGGARDDDEPGTLRRRAMFYLSPLLAPLMRLSVRGGAAFEADALAGLAADHPLALAQALRKLAAALPASPPLEADPATWHLFLIDPDPDWAPGCLFWRRPSIEQRVRRLRGLRQEAA